MILALDVGNTNIVIGGFDGDNLAFVTTMASLSSETSDEYAARISAVLNLHKVDKKLISGAIISSVVPSINNTIKSALKFAYGIEPLFVGPGVKTGINIHCDSPSSVGTDLISASVAANFIFGSPVLVIDLGTSTNMIVIDKNGTFIGVSILPGVNTSLSALTNSTAQLPQISLEDPRNVIGKNTVDSMKSGIIFGSASAIDGMIERIKDELGYDLSLLATGAFAHAIIPNCKHNIVIDENLVLKGLNIIYKRNK